MNDYEERRQQAEFSRINAEQGGNRNGVNSGGCVVLLAAIGLTTVLFLTSFFASASYVNAQQQNDKVKKIDSWSKKLETRSQRFSDMYSDIQRAKDLVVAAKDLRREFTGKSSWQESRDEVQRCLDIKDDIDKLVADCSKTQGSRCRFQGEGSQSWKDVRASLSKLADFYDLTFKE